MPLGTLAQPAGISTPKTAAQLPFPLFVNGNEISQGVSGADALSYTLRDPGFTGPQLFSFTIHDHTNAVRPWIAKQQPVLWFDATRSTPLFWGYIKDVSLQTRATWVDITVTCSDRSEGLDYGRPIVSVDAGTRKTDAAAIGVLVGTYGQDVSSAGGYIQTLDASLPASVPITRSTLRNAIDQVLGATSAVGAAAYVDAFGYLHTITTGDVAAPYTISDSAGYAATVRAASGLAGYWRLGEPSGTVANDVTGNHPGTYVNGPTLGVPGSIADDADTAVSFAAASSQAVLLSNNRILGGLANFSIVVRAKLGSFSGAQLALYCERGGTNDIVRLSVTSANGRPELTYRDDAGTLNVIDASSGSYLDGKFHTFAVTKAGTAVLLYADGVQVGSGTLTATDTMTNAGVPVYLGEDGGDPSIYMNGTLDEAAIWTRALTAAELTNLQNLAIGASIPAAIQVKDQGAADVDALYVYGGTPAGTGPVYAWQCGITTPPRSPMRWATLDAPQAVDANGAISAATVEFQRRQQAIVVTVTVSPDSVRGSLDGWAKGQLLTVTNSALGYSGKQFTITAVDMVVINGKGQRRYTITAGTDPVLFTRRVHRVHGKIKHVPLPTSSVVGALGNRGSLPPAR